MRFGLGVFADEVESDLRSNPVIIEHIGRFEEFELDLGASIASEGNEDFVFRVSGTKGSGLITATCVTNDVRHRGGRRRYDPARIRRNAELVS